MSDEKDKKPPKEVVELEAKMPALVIAAHPTTNSYAIALTEYLGKNCTSIIFEFFYFLVVGPIRIFPKDAGWNSDLLLPTSTPKLITLKGISPIKIFTRLDKIELGKKLMTFKAANIMPFEGCNHSELIERLTSIYALDFFDYTDTKVIKICISLVFFLLFSATLGELEQR